MIINLRLYPGGGIDCLSENCSFRKECANHYTAGDYRSEDGFSPEWQSIPNEIDKVTCLTTDRDFLEDDDNIMLLLPENYNELNRGALLVKDLQEIQSSNFCI